MMKDLFTWIKKVWLNYVPILILLALLLLIHIFSKNSLKLAELISAIAASGITAIGWIFTFQLNKATFQRSEIIKNRDKLVQLIEKFFDELFELFEKRATTEQDIENFITDKVPEIESKTYQIKRIFKKNNVVFLSNEMLARLQSEPLDIFAGEHAESKGKLQSMKKQALAEIDKLYEEWLDTF